MLHIKRVYDPPSDSDGFRVLVDRLWPRGLSKEQAKLDAWLKDIAPSAALRIWFNHEPEKFAVFRGRYRQELTKNGTAVAELQTLLSRHRTLTLLYGAKSPAVNHAVVLQKFLQNDGAGEP